MRLPAWKRGSRYLLAGLSVNAPDGWILIDARGYEARVEMGEESGKLRLAAFTSLSRAEVSRAGGPRLPKLT